MSFENASIALGLVGALEVNGPLRLPKMAKMRLG
jgi:hypothetical protein